MKEFKYDVEALLQGVKERPCLWDRTLENYKDRVERRNAWEEIFNMLDPKYEEMSWEDKKTTGELIINKWTNIRDTFVKTLKTKMGKPKKKYLLHNHLKFLTKVVPEVRDDTEEAEYSVEAPPVFMKQEMKEGEEGTSHNTKKKKKVDYNDEYVPKKTRRSKERVQSQSQDSDYETFDTGNDNIDFVEVNSDPRLMNEDEAFFASLLPTVVKYSEDERLEFRIEVLAVMKKIKDKRNNWITGD